MNTIPQARIDKPTVKEVQEATVVMWSLLLDTPLKLSTSDRQSLQQIQSWLRQEFLG